MATINKPSQPLIPPTDVEEVEEIAANAAEAAIAADDTHAPLVDDKVPAEHLPSYVDDVLEYKNLAAFPRIGEEGKIYVALDTNNTYRWSGSAYVQVGSAPSFVYHVDFNPATSETGHDFTGTMSDEDYEQLMSDPEHALIIVNPRNSVKYVLRLVTYMLMEEPPDLPMYGFITPEGVAVTWAVHSSKTWRGALQDPVFYTKQETENLIQQAVGNVLNQEF